MKVAMVSACYPPFIGGVETHVQEVSEGLTAKGLEVEVLTTDNSSRLPTEQKIGRITVRRFKCWAPNNAYYFSESLRKYLFTHSSSFDIVHAHGYSSLPPLYAAQAKVDNRLVFTPHYTGPRGTSFRSLLHVPYRLIARKIIERSDAIINVSNYDRQMLLQSFRVDEKKISVIPNGVHKKEFKHLQRQRNRGHIILSVGRLERYKGMQYLVSVLPTLKEDVTLEIIGKGSYKANLVDLAKRLEVFDRVKFLENLPRSELLQKYVDADVFCLLSEHESYAITVAEALCAGTPCVVFNTSALAEWVDNKNCFGLDSPKDADTLKVLINNLLDKRIQYTQIWDWEEVVEKLLNIYENLLN